MRRKPILFKKINVDEGKVKYRQTIGIIGTHHGTGVTHSGLLLAFYLGEKLGKRTALLECNTHHDMNLIQAAYDWDSDETDIFSFRKITCFKNVSANRIPEILSDSYEFFILDFGIDFLTHRMEFLRCGTKIVIGGQSEWEIHRLNEFIEKVGAIRGNENWLYLIPYAGIKTIKRLQAQWKRNFYAVPFQPEPTLCSKLVNRFFYEQVKFR